MTQLDSATTATGGTREDGRRVRRTRVILSAILVVLMLLLAALGYFVYRLVEPAGGPQSAVREDGLEWVRSIYGYGPTADEQFLGPTDAAFGPDGRIWGTDPKRARVLGFEPDGAFSTLIHQGPAAVGEGRIFSPEGVTVGENGHIYVADFGAEKISEYTADNEFVREFEVPLPSVVDQRGDIIAVGTVQGVALHDLDGAFITKWGTRGPGPDQFDVIHGIAIAEDGTIFVSDTQNQRVKAYTQQGKLLWMSGSGAERSGNEAPDADGADAAEQVALQLPAGITVDGAGRPVLVDPFEFAIIVLDPETGAEIARYGAYGGSDGEFAYPTGIDYDPLRDWFVIADTANNRLQIVRIPGSGGGVLEGIRRAATGPVWLCALPLVLLLVAAVVLATSRRRAARAAEHESIVWRDGEAAPE